MSRRLFIDLDKCIECSECRVRCAAWYRTKDNESAVLTLRELAAFAVYCRRCEEAPCVAACRYGALERDENGVLHRWNLRCVSCKACSHACPFGTILPDVLTFYVVQCDRCLAAGGQPACVEGCPEGAIEFREVSPGEPGVHLVGDWLAVKSFRWEKEAV